MRINLLFVFALLIAYTGVDAQTFQLNSLNLTINSTPKPYSSKMEIQDSFIVLTSASLDGDTTAPVITKERIIRKKGSYAKTYAIGGVNNYDWALSSDKAEKKQNIYVISVLYVSNDGSNRKTIYFKGNLVIE